MIKVLYGRLIKDGKCFEFHIFIHAKDEAIKKLCDVLEQKLQQKGWLVKND